MDIRQTGRPAIVPGEYIVGFQPGTTPEQRHAVVRSLAPQRVEDLGFVDALLVKVAEGKPLTGGSFDPKLVSWVQPNMHHYLRDEPATTGRRAAVDDPEFPKQYHLDNTGQTGGTAGADVNAPQAWQTSTGQGVVVAVADTNIDINHPDLKANIWVNSRELPNNGIDDDNNGFKDDVNGWNFGLNSNKVEQGGGTHGSHVAGIIGAVTNNAVGVAGVAPNVKIMPLGVLTSSATTANAIKAFEYAARNGANIINNSWGNNTYEPALQAAVTQATRAGVMVVVAAGNENWDTGVHGSYPDNYAGSVSVAASDHKDAKASYSNRGTITIDAAAPGDSVLATVPGGYGKKSGTSMASPVYVAVAALVKSKYPGLTMKQVEERVNRSVQRTGTAAVWNPLVASGGRIDAEAALVPIATPGAPAPAGSHHAGEDPGRTPAAARRQVAPSLVLSGAPVQLGWTTDLATGQRYDVMASLNASAVSSVSEDFETGQTTRQFRTAGDAPWAIAEGTAKSGAKSFQVNGLGRDKQSRLELTEVLVEPTEVSFWYRGSRQGELSFFVNRDLQFQPTGSEDWKEFKATLPAGEHTFTWLAAGRGGSGSPFAIDGLQIGKVSDAKWEPVGTTGPDQTSIEWTPSRTTVDARVRVRADNGRFAGDWVAGPVFEVRS